MRVIREYLTFLVMVGMVILCLSALLEETELYKKAYHSLSRFISHPSIEVRVEE